MHITHVLTKASKHKSTRRPKYVIPTYIHACVGQYVHTTHTYIHLLLIYVICTYVCIYIYIYTCRGGET